MLHIVYICSPDREEQLAISLGSLLSSGTEFEKITIVVTGLFKRSWLFQLSNISIVQRPAIGKGFWMANKTHLASIEGDYVVFIDTDTVVLKPLNLLFDRMNADIGGRLTTVSRADNWEDDIWQDYLQRYGAKKNFPYINSGLLAFKGGAQKSLHPKWLEITRDLRAMDKNPFGNRSQSNQQALSLACGAMGLSYHLFTKEQHAYGWEDNDYTNSIVFHIGDYHFFPVIELLKRNMNLLNSNTMFTWSFKARQYYKYCLQRIALKLPNIII